MHHYDYGAYFRALEEDFIDTISYVELHKENYGTFSQKFVKIILSACSEVDVVCKLICKELDKEFKKEKPTMGDYQKIIPKGVPDIVDQQVFLSLDDRINYHTPISDPKIDVIKPWENWNSSASIKWWTDYNAIKHERSANYERANLKNAIYSMAGLVVLLAQYSNLDSKSLGVQTRLFGTKHVASYTAARWGEG